MAIEVTLASTCCRYDSLASDVDRIRSSEEAKAAEVVALKSAVSAREDALDVARSATDRLQSELAAACSARQTSEALCAKLNGQIETANSELASLCSTHAQLLQSTEKASLREQELVQQLCQLTASFNASSTELQARGATIGLLEAQLAQLREARRSSNAGHESEGRSMKEQIALLQARCAALVQKESQLQAREDRVAELEAQIGEVQAASAKAAQQFNERLHKARADADRSVEELEALKKQTVKIEGGLREDLEKYEQDLQSALNALQKANTNLKSTADAKAALDAEKESLLEKLARLEVSVKDSRGLSTEAEELRRAVGTLSAENDELRKKVEKASTGSTEVALRIEVDRLGRALAKERRLFDLRISDMREQLQASAELEAVRKERDEFEQKYLTLLAKVSTATPKAADKKPLIGVDSALRRAAKLRAPVPVGEELAAEASENGQPPRKSQLSPSGDCKQQ